MQPITTIPPNQHMLRAQLKEKPVLHSLHNWWRIRALGFHQGTMKESRQETETMKNSTKTTGLLLYKTLHYLSTQALLHFLYTVFET